MFTVIYGERGLTSVILESFMCIYLNKWTNFWNFKFDDSQLHTINCLPFVKYPTR